MKTQVSETAGSCGEAPAKGKVASRAIDDWQGLAGSRPTVWIACHQFTVLLCRSLAVLLTSCCAVACGRCCC